MNPTTPDTSSRTALQQLLIQQFMLHEIQHHDLGGSPAARQTTVVPRAHELADIYKCLHQGEFGVGHSIYQPAGFQQHLERELRRCLSFGEAGHCEPVLETVSCDQRILRVNLRPLGRQYAGRLEHASEVLTRVCLQSANITEGSEERFFNTLELFQQINAAGEIRIAGQAFVIPVPLTARFLSDVRQFARRSGQVPVLSHSAAYRGLNHPAYRVVDRAALETSPLKDLLAAEESGSPPKAGLP